MFKNKKMKNYLVPQTWKSRFLHSTGQILKGFMIHFSSAGTPSTGGISTHAQQRKSLWQLFTFPCGGKREEVGVLGPKSVALDSTQKLQSQCQSGEQWAVSTSPQPTASSSPAVGQACGLDAPELWGLKIPFTQVGSASGIRLFLKVSAPFLRIWLLAN